MRKCFFLVFLFVAAFAFGDQSKQAVDPELQEFVKRYYEAWNTMKSENADPFYAKDTDIVFFDAAPMQYKSWKEYKEGAQKLFFDTTKTCKLIPHDDLRTFRHDDVAWFTLTFHLSAEMKSGPPTELELRQTSILEKREGKWVIVHEHISAPLSLAESAASK
jgi:ketosteroid isomerase-like protein